MNYKCFLWTLLFYGSQNYHNVFLFSVSAEEYSDVFISRS